MQKLTGAEYHLRMQRRYIYIQSGNALLIGMMFCKSTTGGHSSK